MTEQDAPRPVCRRWGLLADAALILCLVALGVKAAYGGWEIRDLDSADECSYAFAAVMTPKVGLPGVEGSPAYILWNYLLYRAGVEPANIPFLNWAILASLLPVSLYLLIRAIGGGRVAAFAAAGMLPATTLIDIYPYPMHMATVVLVLGTALATRFRRAAPTAAVLGLTLLLANFTRPEFLYSLFLFLPLAALGGVWMLWKRPESRRSVLLSGLGFTAGAGLLVWGFGSPKGDGSRSIVAFGQHYAHNRAMTGARGENPWHLWQLYVEDDFGKVSTLGEAWRANRGAFLWHVERNARGLPKHLCAAVAPRIELWTLHEWQIFPPETAPKHPRTEAIVWRMILAAVVFGLVGVVIGLRRQLLGGEEGGKLPVVVLMLGFVAAPALAASLIVYPRFHYLIPTIVFSTALLAAGYRYLPVPARLRGRLASVLAVIAIAAGLALVVPNRAKGWCLQCRLGEGENGKSIVQSPTPMRACVRTIRGLGLPERVVFLDYSIGRSFYSGYEVKMFFPSHVPPEEGLAKFVRQRKVGIVVVDAVMAEAPQLRDDPEYRALLEGKETKLFRLVTVEDFPYIRLAVRRDLLPAGN